MSTEDLTKPLSTDSARRAAEEIAANYEVHKDRCHSNERYPSPPCDCGAIEEVAAIIERHAAAPADNDAESLLQHVACSEVEFDDNGLGYVVVQIDRDVWERLQAHKGAR